MNVYGHARSPTDFQASELKLRDPAASRKYEVEGRIAGPVRQADRELVFALAERQVCVGPKTKLTLAQAETTTVAGTSTVDPWLNGTDGRAQRKEELYHLPKDPGERENLATARVDKLEEMRSHLAALRAKSHDEPAPTRDLAEPDLQKLRALGYAE